MKTVCVSTYCEWSSYGSVMQAIGLKKALMKLGYRSFIIRDVPAPLSEKDFPFCLSKNPKILIKNILSSHCRAAKKDQYKQSVMFINKNIDIKYYNDYEVLRESPPKADFFIAGSDQIWHPALCKPAFFLDFLPSDKRRLSYAASMGMTDIPREKAKLFKNLINKFDFLSVREKEMVSMLQGFSGKEINVHIDPSFFLNSSEWGFYKTQYPVNKPYILVFPIYWNSGLNKELKLLHKKTGYDIVALCPNSILNIWANKKIYDADPGQFLHLIDNAEAVISSSFHGVALALNFNKKIAAIINPDASSRLNSLLNILNVPRYTISNVMDFDLSDYISINKRIAYEKEKGLSYLKKILEDKP